MALPTGWGDIYCKSEWGDESNRFAVPEFPEFCEIIQGICGIYTPIQETKTIQRDTFLI